MGADSSSLDTEKALKIEDLEILPPPSPAMIRLGKKGKSEKKPEEKIKKKDKYDEKAASEKKKFEDEKRKMEEQLKQEREKELAKIRLIKEKERLMVAREKELLEQRELEEEIRIAREKRKLEEKRKKQIAKALRQREKEKIKEAERREKEQRKIRKLKDKERSFKITDRLYELDDKIWKIDKHKHILAHDDERLLDLKEKKISTIEEEIRTEKVYEKEVKDIEEELKHYNKLVKSGETDLAEKIEKLNQQHETYKEKAETLRIDILNKLKRARELNEDKVEEELEQQRLEEKRKQDILRQEQLTIKQKEDEKLKQQRLEEKRKQDMERQAQLAIKKQEDEKLQKQRDIELEKKREIDQKQKEREQKEQKKQELIEETRKARAKARKELKKNILKIPHTLGLYHTQEEKKKIAAEKARALREKKLAINQKEEEEKRAEQIELEDKERIDKIESTISRLKGNIENINKHEIILKHSEKNLQKLEHSEIAKIKEEVKSENSCKKELQSLEKDIAHYKKLVSSGKTNLTSKITELTTLYDSYQNKSETIRKDIIKRAEEAKELIKKAKEEREEEVLLEQQKKEAEAKEKLLKERELELKKQKIADQKAREKKQKALKKQELIEETREARAKARKELKKNILKIPHTLGLYHTQEEKKKIAAEKARKELEIKKQKEEEKLKQEELKKQKSKEKKSFLDTLFKKKEMKMPAPPSPKDQMGSLTLEIPPIPEERKKELWEERQLELEELKKDRKLEKQRLKELKESKKLAGQRGKKLKKAILEIPHTLGLYTTPEEKENLVAERKRLLKQKELKKQELIEETREARSKARRKLKKNFLKIPHALGLYHTREEKRQLKVERERKITEIKKAREAKKPFFKQLFKKKEMKMPTPPTPSKSKIELTKSEETKLKKQRDKIFDKQAEKREEDIDYEHGIRKLSSKLDGYMNNIDEHKKILDYDGAKLSDLDDRYICAIEEDLKPNKEVSKEIKNMGKEVSDYQKWHESKIKEGKTDFIPRMEQLSDLYDKYKTQGQEIREDILDTVKQAKELKLKKEEAPIREKVEKLQKEEITKAIEEVKEKPIIEEISEIEIEVEPEKIKPEEPLLEEIPQMEIDIEPEKVGEKIEGPAPKPKKAKKRKLTKLEKLEQQKQKITEILESLPEGELTKEAKTDLDLINQKIAESQVAIANFNLEKAKLLYIEILPIYYRLPNDQQKEVYSLIKDLYNERKNVEKLKVA